MSTLANQAYQAIKADIIRGNLDQETPFTQSMLADQFDFGLAAIRSALLQLTNEGFIRSIPRYGYMIIPVTISDVHDIFELRKTLEPLAARLAAKRAPDDIIEKICEAATHTYIYDDLESYSEFLSHNSTFHLSIAGAAGNQRLWTILAKLLEDSNQVFYLALDAVDNAEETLKEHIALSKAIKDRDPDLAETIALKQIIRTRDHVLAAITRSRNRVTPIRSINDLTV